MNTTKRQSYDTRNNQQAKDILLFPGEEYQFNRNLLFYNAFSYNNKQFITKKCALLNIKSLINLNTKNSDITSKEPLMTIGKLYSPKKEDVIIGTITVKTFEQYRLDIGTSHEALLNSIDFEGATRKTKPNLQVGDLIFAKIYHTNKFDNTILTCKSDDNSKTWSSGESLFGQLVKGNVYCFPRIWSWKLINNNYTIERLKDYVDFEICIGMNGRLWINSDNINDISKIHNAIIKSFELNREQMESLLNNTFNTNQ